MTSRGQLSIHFQQLIQNFGFIHIYMEYGYVAVCSLYLWCTCLLNVMGV